MIEFANLQFYKEKRFKETPIGKIPEDWNLMSFGKILREVNLRVRDVKTLSKLPILSLTKNFGLIPQSRRFHKKIATSCVDKYKVIKKGWLVYNPYVIWEGAICVLRNIELGVVSPVYLVWKITSNVDCWFLDYLVQTKVMLDIFLKFATGSVQRRRSLKKRDFLKIQIPIPPLEEQKAVAHILSTIDEAIQKTNEIIEKIKRLKKGLMQELLTKGIGHKEFKDTEIGRIPKEWEVVRLKEVVLEVKPGFPCGKRDESGVIQLRMDSIDIEGWINPTAYVKVPPPKNVEEYLLRPGDILFNNTNSIDLIGKTAIFRGEFSECVYSNHLTRIRINPNKVIPEWLLYVLIRKWQLGIFKAICHPHVHQAGINKGDLLNLKIPLPSLEEQDKIIRMILTVDKKLKIEIKRKEKLKRIKKALMDLLLTGKIRVKVDCNEQRN